MITFILWRQSCAELQVSVISRNEVAVVSCADQEIPWAEPMVFGTLEMLRPVFRLLGLLTLLAFTSRGSSTRGLQWEIRRVHSWKTCSVPRTSCSAKLSGLVVMK